MNVKMSRISPCLSVGLQVERLLREYLDISAVPGRYFFELLAFFASDPRERTRLIDLASAEMQVGSLTTIVC